MSSLSVLMIGSEAVPFAKTGGLADVLGALPAALARLGWNVVVAIPRYRGVTAGRLVDRSTLAVGGYVRQVGIFEAPFEHGHVLSERSESKGESKGARAWLVDVPDLFDREQLYGTAAGDYSDNARRFAVLVRAVLEHAARQMEPPSIVHAHDWQAGLAPVYLKTMYAGHSRLAAVPTVFTIHNLAYQGLFEPDWLPRLDLPWSLSSIDALEFWGRISFMKGGINYSDLITTVSPRYAREIQTRDLGFGFDGILRRRADALVGILNGIDTEQWDPARDRFLPAPFSASNLEAKRESKRAVLERLALPADSEALERPMLGIISRMVDQKGFDLIAAAANELVQLDATFAVLGSGEARYQNLWRDLAERHPDRIGTRIGFDEALAHLIEAGADIFLMPSRFEPCGLNQMYSLRYGTVPVVREVGGLADTVRDCRPGVDRCTGFVFEEYTAEAVLAALRRALAVFKDRRQWRALQLAGMAEDYSWDRSAREYVKIYERLLTSRGLGLGARG